MRYLLVSFCALSLLAAGPGRAGDMRAIPLEYLSAAPGTSAWESFPEPVGISPDLVSHPFAFDHFTPERSAPAWRASFPSKSVFLPDAGALPRTVRGQSPVTCLALAIYHEARGEPLAGQKAVASVVMQRARTPGRWGHSICGVLAPTAMSFVRRDLGTPPIHDLAAWHRSMDLARAMYRNGPLARLRGADHYHTTSVHPSWDRAMRRVAVIGSHVFFASHPN